MAASPDWVVMPGIALAHRRLTAPPPPSPFEVRNSNGIPTTSGYNAFTTENPFLGTLLEISTRYMTFFWGEGSEGVEKPRDPGSKFGKKCCHCLSRSVLRVSNAMGVGTS